MRIDELGMFEQTIDRALAEDLHAGDVTTRTMVPATRHGMANIVAKAPLVLAGIDVAAAVFRRLDPAVTVDVRVSDGAALSAGTVVAAVEGPARAILAAERTALNLLQHLCGVATQTRQFVEAARGRCRITDTRKTLPGLRALQRYAVRCGGGHNHRNDLGAGVLIKENHIVCAGGIGPAIAAARAHAPHVLRVACEARSVDEVRQAIAAGADAVLLDNMGLPSLAEAVRITAGRALLEVSGGVTLERVDELAALGIDVISVGALTHSVLAADLSLVFEDVEVSVE